MGNDALRMFLGQNYPAVSRVYGDLYLVEEEGYEYLLIPVQHPGFILRHPDEAENTFILLEKVSEIIRDPQAYNLPWREDGTIA